MAKSHGFGKRLEAFARISRSYGKTQNPHGKFQSQRVFFHTLKNISTFSKTKTIQADL